MGQRVVALDGGVSGSEGDIVSEEQVEGLGIFVRVSVLRWRWGEFFGLIIYID